MPTKESNHHPTTAAQLEPAVPETEVVAVPPLEKARLAFQAEQEKRKLAFLKKVLAELARLAETTWQRSSLTTTFPQAHFINTFQTFADFEYPSTNTGSDQAATEAAAQELGVQTFELDHILGIRAPLEILELFVQGFDAPYLRIGSEKISVSPGGFHAIERSIASRANKFVIRDSALTATLRVPVEFLDEHLENQVISFQLGIAKVAPQKPEDLDEPTFYPLILGTHTDRPLTYATENLQRALDLAFGVHGRLAEVLPYQIPKETALSETEAYRFLQLMAIHEVLISSRKSGSLKFESMVSLDRFPRNLAEFFEKVFPEVLDKLRIRQQFNGKWGNFSYQLLDIDTFAKKGVSPGTTNENAFKELEKNPWYVLQAIGTAYSNKKPYATGVVYCKVRLFYVDRSPELRLGVVGGNFSDLLTALSLTGRKSHQTLANAYLHPFEGGLPGSNS